MAKIKFVIILLMIKDRYNVNLRIDNCVKFLKFFFIYYLLIIFCTYDS